MAVEPETWIDGRFVSGADLSALGATGYGALTSFRVEEGAVRGLDLHLERLSFSANILFGRDITASTILEQLNRSLDGRPEAWARISLFSDQITPRKPDVIVEPRVLVNLSEPPAPIAHGQRVMPYRLERFLPEIKHSATMEVLYARRIARLAGFDDAVLVDRDGALTEGTLWNIGFVKGDTVVWPTGLMLSGVTRNLISQGLMQMGVSQRDMRISQDALGAFDAAFLCNSSTPCASIAYIGDHRFPGADAMLEKVSAAWALHPPQRLAA